MHQNRIVMGVFLSAILLIFSSSLGIAGDCTILRYGTSTVWSEYFHAGEHCFNITDHCESSKRCGVPSGCVCGGNNCHFGHTPPPYRCLSQNDPPCAPGCDNYCLGLIEKCIHHECFSYCYDLKCMEYSKCQSYWDDGNCFVLECVGAPPGSSGPITYGRIDIDPAQGNPNSSAPMAQRYYPEYDDVLEYDIRVSRSMTVELVLSASTYEGIAMNAPLPSTELETEADLSLSVGALDGWISSEVSWQGNKKVFKMHRHIVKSECPVRIAIRVLDYAAEGTLTGHEYENINNVAHGGATIPYAASVFKKNEDPDMDGLTRWEEYRGFIVIEDNAPTIKRLDSLIVELFYQDNDLTMDEAFLADLASSNFLNAKLVNFGPGIGNYSMPLIENYLNTTMARYFIDFNYRQYNVQHQLVPNGLCTPNGLETFPWTYEEIHDVIESAENTVVQLDLDRTTEVEEEDGPGYTIGSTIQYKMSMPDYESIPYEFCNPEQLYPGSGGCGGITIYQREIELLLQAIKEISYYNYPPNTPTVDNLFIDQQIKRGIAHEFGHVVSINHHCSHNPFIDEPEQGGDWGCVMKYDYGPIDYPNDHGGWTQWVREYGEGYLVDDYGCRSSIAYRPVDENEWPVR